MGWLEEAIKRGHDPATCRCVSCISLRGEARPAEMKRKKTADRRGYLWLSNEDDARVHETADLLGETLGEFVRVAIKTRLDSVANDISNSLEAG